MADLKLDRDHMRQLLLQPAFYAACPEFAHLQATAAASHALYEHDKRAQNLCCGADWRYYRGVVDAFFLRVRELHGTGNADALVRMKVYLGSKKGYRPDKIVIYYRRSKSQGKIGKLVV